MQIAHKSWSTVASFPSPVRLGYCTETRDNDAGDCSSGNLGMWSAGLNGIANLADCAQRCLGCQRCRAVSYSPKNDDCSVRIVTRHTASSQTHTVEHGSGAAAASPLPPERHRPVSRERSSILSPWRATSFLSHSGTIAATLIASRRRASAEISRVRESSNQTPSSGQQQQRRRRRRQTRRSPPRAAVGRGGVSPSQRRHRRMRCSLLHGRPDSAHPPTRRAIATRTTEDRGALPSMQFTAWRSASTCVGSARAAPTSRSPSRHCIRTAAGTLRVTSQT